MGKNSSLNLPKKDNTKTIETTGQKIGKYVKYQREKRSLSINEFAKQCNLSPSFVARLEQSAYDTVTYDVIEKLAHGFSMLRRDLLYKAGLIRSTSKLPPIDYFLREEYQLPQEAIDTVKLIIEFMQFKHEAAIAELDKMDILFSDPKKNTTSNIL